MSFPRKRISHVTTAKAKIGVKGSHVLEGTAFFWTLRGGPRALVDPFCFPSDFLLWGGWTSTANVGLRLPTLGVLKV